MTSELRTFIEAGDISGIEVGCPKCHLTLFYPVDVEKAIELLARCPHCSHDFFDELRTNRGYPHSEYPAINDLQKIAAALRTLLRPDRTDIHAQIRFRIANENS